MINYTSFPSATSVLPPIDTATNQVNAKNFYGTGSFGGSTGFNLGGPTGVNINGTQGLWAGDSNFSSAPFSVDLAGNVVASTLTVAGAILTGGAAADINAHATTVDGGKITGASITNSQISSSTITGGSIAAGTITGTNIAAATISTGQIAANTITGGNIAASTITATNLSVSTLSAISANLGTVTAGTITGATYQTASSGQRIVIDSGNQFKAISSTGKTMLIYGSGGNCVIDANATAGQLVVFGDLTVVASGATSTIALGGNTNVTGNLSCSGTKPFDIEHPDGTPKKRLRYIATEAPEVLVMCRGIAENEEEIEYPQHFIDVSEPDTIQCQIGKLRGSEKISWLATAIRKGYKNFDPEYYGESPTDYRDPQ